MKTKFLTDEDKTIEKERKLVKEIVNMKPELTEQEENKRGEFLAKVFGLIVDENYPDRYQTSWGTKTALGVFRTAKRIIEEGK